MPELGEVGEQIASLSRADVVAELRRQWQSRKTGQGGCTGAASLGGETETSGASYTHLEMHLEWNESDIR
jgi:hypothetical protein